MKKRNGLFITFEGIDGCGKSTQAKKAFSLLKKEGYPVVLLREPGGTPVSEKIRKILLDRNLDINPEAELLLYEAARAQITAKKILPVLESNGIVICDRYYDSTIAYQGYGRKLDINFINRLNRVASYYTTPDITFVFDVNYQTSLSRRNKTPDRLEKEKQAFFNRVRKGFKELAGKRRIILLNGKKDIETLSEQVLTVVQKAVAGKKIKLAG
ncbi:MAG: dTMP kinase [candidate division Zixibacteria bacterium]|nr:dTMP kinase [candidate division Zixibacteria bacterium]